MAKVKCIAVAAFLLAGLSGYAQQKIGYADWNYIFGALPEFKQIDTDLKAHGDLLQQQIQSKQAEMEKKLKEFQALPATTPDAVRADNQRELQQMDQGLQQFDTDAKKSYEARRSQLMDPIFAKVGKAIEDVAKENGYAFILNPTLMGGGDILLVTDKKFDISDLVLKKLGVTPPPKTVPK
jgi:outer membrane protein